MEAAGWPTESQDNRAHSGGKTISGGDLRPILVCIRFGRNNVLILSTYLADHGTVLAERLGLDITRSM